MSKFFWLRDTLVRLLVKQTVTTLTVIFCLASLIVLGNIYYFSQQIVKNQAIEHARQSISALKKARAIYNTEVVERLDDLGTIKATHDYENHPNTIPLPATYLRYLGHQISQSIGEMQVRLCSEYPFPWREGEGGIKTDLEAKAMAFFHEYPESPFYQFIRLENSPALFYAEADIMRPECIDCHNHYPGTPKTDWQVGDVRGIVGVTLMLGYVSDYINQGLKGTILLLLTMSAIGISGLSLSIRRLRLYSKELERRVTVRQEAMEQAFTAIHNGPLQTLALLLREIKEKEANNAFLWTKIKSLDTEIREVGHNLTQESLVNTLDKATMRLGDGTILDLSRPLHELLYEIYTLTLQRDFPNFAQVKVKVRNFEPVDTPKLNLEDKREICRWLEEMLCNIGKHATGTTRVTATGKIVEKRYILEVKDNGPGITDVQENRGTKQAKKLASRLGGDFYRSSLPRGGTICQFSWLLK